MVAFDHVLPIWLYASYPHVFVMSVGARVCKQDVLSLKLRSRLVCAQSSNETARTDSVDSELTGFLFQALIKLATVPPTMAKCIRTKEIKISFQHLCRKRMRLFSPDARTRLLRVSLGCNNKHSPRKGTESMYKGTSVLRYFGRKKRMTDDSLEAHTFSFLTAHRQDHRSSPHPRQPTQQRDLLACYSRFVARRPTWPQ